MRLLLEKSDDRGKVTLGSPLYLIGRDIALSTRELAARGVKFNSPEGKLYPIARMLKTRTATPSR